MNAAVAPLTEAGLVAAVMELAGVHAALRRRGIAPLPVCEQQARLTFSIPLIPQTCTRQSGSLAKDAAM